MRLRTFVRARDEEKEEKKAGAERFPERKGRDNGPYEPSRRIDLDSPDVKAYLAENFFSTAASRDSMQKRGERENRPIRFPHGPLISASLGVSPDFKSVVDAEGCKEKNTAAFTEGDVTHFENENPDIHIAAHEAVHQLQHAQKTWDQGMGAEGHANAVANRIKRGDRAGSFVGMSGSPVTATTHAYSIAFDHDGVWQAGRTQEDIDADTISRNGKLSGTGETLTFGTQEAYATSNQITASNAILTSLGSSVALSQGSGGISVISPDGSGAKQLSKVSAKVDNQTDVCEKMAEQVMGGDKSFKMLASAGGDRVEIKKIEWQNSPVEQWLTYLLLRQRIASIPDYASYSDEQKKAVFAEIQQQLETIKSQGGQNAIWDEIRELDPDLASRNTIDDAEAGIDEYANPKVGEAYARFDNKNDATGYPHHFAAVVMAPGSDRVTLENSAGRGASAWFFDTYGTRVDPTADAATQDMQRQQTFHYKNSAIGGHTTVMRTQSVPVQKGTLPAGMENIPSMTTAELLNKYCEGKSDLERVIIAQELGKRRINITVRINDAHEYFTQDDVFVALRDSGFTTDVVSFEQGASHTFSVSLGTIVAVVDILDLFTEEPLVFDIKEKGPLGSTTIGTIRLPFPYGAYGPVTLTGGGAEYEVTVSP